uniref:Uncharacterized protein B9B11.170 n=1 Tax=Neurospora crassa TaxID=5141 RepID=Q873I2_NEUCS|nr:conserved hypothetical protein [Neurospora crassa]
MADSSKHAIVFGASGLIGWAIVNQLLRGYPRHGTFSNITAVTNRPLDTSESLWPTDSDQPDLQLVSGIDLHKGDGATLAESLKQAVKDVESVTHIYYLVENDIDEVAINRRMFQNVVDAHTILSPNLQFVAFAGGTRGYGIYTPGGTFTPPLTEDMVKNLPPDYAKTVVYPAYRELLSAASKGKHWTWCEVCPDAIFSLALHWAQYLSLYTYNHGVRPSATEAATSSVEVPFPGNAAGASSLFSPVSSATIARFMIYASLHPETCGGGRLFNVADNETPCKYGEIWPHLANWFGLVGVGPVAEKASAPDNSMGAGELPESTSLLPPGEYVTKYRSIFNQNGRENAATKGVGAGHRQLDSVGYWLTFDRQLSITKLRETGFEGDKDPVQGWLSAFEMFRKAGLIL